MLTQSKLYFVLAVALLSFSASARVVAQASTGELFAENASSSAVVPVGSDPASSQVQAGPQLPEPGQPGSPFSVDHFWRRISLEVGGGYSPVLNRGVGYYGPGFTATVGAFYRINRHWGLLGEGQILGQHGNFSTPTCDTPGQCDNGSVASYIVAFHADPIYYLRPGFATSPYVVGGGGFYHLGTHAACGPFAGTGCLTTSNDPFVTDVLSVNAAGFNFGAGVRHRLFDVRQTELFADVRYHFIASGSSSVGQVSFLPITAGVRW